MAFTTPTTNRVSRHGRGRLWADFDLSVATADVLYFPAGGQGLNAAAGNSAIDPERYSNWVNFFGFSVLAVPTGNTTVSFRNSAGTELFVYIVDTTTVIGNYYPAEMAGAAAWEGVSVSSSAEGGHTFNNPGILMSGMGFRFPTGTNDLKIRIWFRHETSFGKRY